LNIVAVSGYKDSGKSTLCGIMVSALSKRGLSVGYIKRTEEFVASRGDTDSGAICALGVPALLWGKDSFRFEKICSQSGNADVYSIAGMYFPQADIVILEGGKDLLLPKIWVLRENEQPPDDKGIFALYDRYGNGDGGLRYGADDLDRLVLDIAGRVKSRGSVRVYMDEKEIAMKNFVGDFIAGGVRGMLDSLKKPLNCDTSGNIRIYLDKK
jgi:molybdopterin-guanine dinucleotide biosynthesis protein B